MRIIIDARLYGVEHRGLGQYIKELIYNLSLQDSKNDYILLVNPTNRDKPTNLGSNFSYALAPWRVYSLAEQINLPRLILNLKPDLVHFPHFAVPLFLRTPFVVTIHDLILHHFPSERATTLPWPLYWFKILFYHLVINSAVKRARRVITISQATADDIIHYYPKVEKKINVITLAPALSSQPAIISLPSNYFLLVGAAYPHKNLEFVVRALDKVRESLPEVKLIVSGRRDVFMQRLEQYVKNNGLEQSVLFWGEATASDLAALYKHACAYLFPSLLEGFGLGALEALTYGTPVIVSDIKVFHEVLNEAAIYFDPYNETALVEALVDVVKNNSNWRDKFESLAPLVLKKYSWQTTAQATLGVYNQVVKT